MMKSILSLQMNILKIILFIKRLIMFLYKFVDVFILKIQFRK